MQKIAALSNLVAYYCVALPVGAALMFKAQLNILGKHSLCSHRLRLAVRGTRFEHAEVALSQRLVQSSQIVRLQHGHFSLCASMISTLFSGQGLWLGLLVCSVLEVVFFLILIFRLDWKKVTHEVTHQHHTEPNASIGETVLASWYFLG